MQSPKVKKKASRSVTRGSRDNHGGEKKTGTATPTKGKRGASVQNLSLNTGMQSHGVNEPASPITSVSPKTKLRRKSNRQTRSSSSSMAGDVGKINLNADTLAPKQKKLGLTSSETKQVMFSPAGYRKDELHNQKGEKGEEGSGRWKDHSYTNYDLRDGEHYDDDEIRVIKSLPPLPQVMKTLQAQGDTRSPLPPKRKGGPPITLALDLDETLVHCSVEPMPDAEMTFSVNFNGMDYQVYVRMRPHLQTFLSQVSKWFEIVIFTASQKVYADKLLNILDPDGKFISHRLFRDSCVFVHGTYVKDLHICKRDMRRVCLVDNSVQAFGFQVENGIPIESWFEDTEDRELLNLISFLKNLKDETDDVRPLIKDTFGLKKYIASVDL